MTELKNFRGIENTNFFEEDKGFQSLLEELLPRDLKEEVFASLKDCANL